MKDFKQFCPNPDCVCGIPGKPCKESMTGWHGYCDRCGWLERNHSPMKANRKLIHKGKVPRA